MSRFASRLLRPLLAALGAAALTACCPEGKCIKEPPCRPSENPCCLSTVQKTALSKGTHALAGGPVAYVHGENKYLLFTEKGLEDFEKDRGAFEEKGAVRIVRDEVYRVDVNPGDDHDFAALAATARPFSK